MPDVADRLRALFAPHGCTLWLHAREVGGDREIAVDPDEAVVTSSVFKIWVALEFHRQVAAGRVEPERRVRVPAADRTPGPTGLSALADDVEMSLRDLATQMMVVSDHAATDTVLAAIGGPDAVTGTLAALGLSGTRLTGDTRAMLDSLAASAGYPGWRAIQKVDPADVDPAEMTAMQRGIVDADEFDPDRATAVSTPRETTTLLDLIWRDAAGPDPACAAVRDVMGRQLGRARIASGFDPDGAGVLVAGKTGSLMGVVRNEAAVVRMPDGRAYAVAVYTRAAESRPGPGPVDGLIGRAARLAVDHLGATPVRAVPFRP
ncbi:MAG: serine hydrolase [Mycobacteriales bacterium]